MKSTDRRLLPSDPLTIHQTCRDIRYVGLRNSQIIRSDLRTPSRGVDVISKMQRGKAVVKVQRLDDSAVPFGLLASGMCSEVSSLTTTMTGDRGRVTEESSSSSSM
jgi:hypothetical protein